MVVEVQKLVKADPEAWHVLHSMAKGIYLDGECYAFAVALSKGLKWPIIGIMQGEVIRHAVVQSPDGSYWDVRGKVSPSKAGLPFGISTCTFKPVVEQDLYNTRPIHELDIRRARTWAETLWPDLPWVDSESARVRAFAEAIESVCREHGFEIFGPIPAQQPMIVKSDDALKGYRVTPTGTGGMFTLTRVIGN